jgi:hypothetical protein
MPSIPLPQLVFLAVAILVIRAVLRPQGPFSL